MGRIGTGRQSRPFIISKSKEALHGPRRTPALAGRLPPRKIAVEFLPRLDIYFSPFSSVVSGISSAKKTNRPATPRTWNFCMKLTLEKLLLLPRAYRSQNRRSRGWERKRAREKKRERWETGAVAVVIISVAVTNSIFPIW